MKKLSLSLLTGLITLGLLFTSKTNALSYIVEGNTQVTIPQRQSQWITTINRGDEDTITVSTGSCSLEEIQGNPYLKCTKTYNDGNPTHTVSLNSTNNIDTMYLNSANIKTITDLDGLNRLINLYLDNNNLELGNNTFTSTQLPSLRLLSLSKNNLTSFYETSILSNLTKLDLSSNKLTTIPDPIRSNRNNCEIELSDTITLGNNVRLVDLRDNEINFIKILNVPDENDTGYVFKRFSYSDNNNTQFKYWTDFTSTGTTNTTGVSIDRFPNGSHYFTVCHDDESVCDTIPFTTTFSSSLSITSPADDYPVDSSEYTFTWQGSHPYLDKFCYELTGNEGLYPTKADCTGSTSLYVDDLIDGGNYVLKVYMVDSSNNILDDIIVEKEFEVIFNRYIMIDTIDPDPITSKDYTFSREAEAEDFINYSYSLTNTDATYSTGGTTTDSSFSVSNLKDGHYTLVVTMQYAGGSEEDTKEFDVLINRNLSVGTNLPGNSITLDNITGTDVIVYRTGSNDWFHHYTYELTRNDQLYSGGGYSDQEIDNTFYRWLPSGRYDFNIKMYDESNKLITQNTTSFTINIPSSLTIDPPVVDTNNATLSRAGFAENFHHYEYSLNRTDVSQQIKAGTRNQYYTGFTVSGLHYGDYTLTVSMKDSGGNTITEDYVTFEISDSLSLSTSIHVGDAQILAGDTINSRAATFARTGQSEDLAGFYYEISGTTFKNEAYIKTGIQTSGINGGLYKAGFGNTTLTNLQTGRYKFTVKMLSSSNSNSAFREKSIDFNVKIPASLEITSPSEGATVTSSNTTFSREGYSDVISKYGYALSYGDQPADSNNFTNNTSVQSPTLKNGDYTLTVWIISGTDSAAQNVAQDTVHFTVNIPSRPSGGGGGGGGGGSSGKTHYNNNLKLSLGNKSPTTNERIELIVKIDDKYTGKVSFPKLQYYSPDTEKWIDIPVTSKNYISEYGDEAKLGYVKFTSDDDGEKELSQFIKLSKSGYYRIFAEDKEGYDADVEVYVSPKKTTTTNNTNTNTNTVTKTSTATTTNSNVNSIIREFLPEVFEEDTEEEVYIARSCKKYTITYSDSLNVYTSPNLNKNEYFVNKDYFKRYIDSKNKYQSGCPTNIGWISTNYSDKSNDNTRYTAPNGKVYFITGSEGNYYSNELNKELKTPTSFKTIQELKYYIRDRNPLISMAALGPTN